MPPDPTTLTTAQQGLRQHAAQIASGVAGVSTVALLAASAALPLMLGPDAALGALAGLGGHALAGWLTDWARQRLAAGGVFEAEPTLTDLARALDARQQQDATLAADVAHLLESTQAVVTVLDALRDDQGNQVRLLQMLAEDLQRATFRNERLHAATDQAVRHEGERLRAALAQSHADLAVPIARLLAQVAMAPSGPQIQGNIHAVGDVYFATTQAIHHHHPTDPLPPIDPAEAAARLAALPTDVPVAIADLPPGSRMPFARNALFTGREADLQQHAASLKAGRSSVVSAGIGGVGKTQLAIEFAHRYGTYFAGGVFWLNCADPGSIPAEIAACGVGMRLPAFAALDFPDQVNRVRQAWQEPIPRLLIFDNCEDPALFTRYRPTSGGCRMLITSRNPVWEASLGVQVQPLATLPRAESIELLRRFRADLRDDDADALAAALGDLPLALHVTGSFLRTYRLTAGAYLRELAAVALDHPALQGRGSTDRPTGRDLNLAKAFALSFDRLQPTDAVDTQALALLARAACFAPGEPFPRDLLRATLPMDADDPTAALDREDALGRLIALGLIEAGEADTLRMHRLLVAYTLRVAPMDGAQEAVEGVLVDAGHTQVNTGIPAAVVPLLVHLRHIWQQADPRGDAEAGTVADALARAERLVGNAAAARLLAERALAIREAVLGAQHPNTAASLNNLAALLKAQGEYVAARLLYERALMICERVFGSRHPNTAQSLNNQAMLFHAQGEYAAAHPLYEHALTIRKQMLGPTHPMTAASLNNLAMLLCAQGDDAAALPLIEQALAITEQVFGPTHPTTATSLNNLAMLFHAQGEYAAAHPLYERALAIRKQILGLNHPDTAASLNNLAWLHADQGQYEHAIPLLKRALDIWFHTLGRDHPQTKSARQNLRAMCQATLLAQLPAPVRDAVQRRDAAAFSHVSATLEETERERVLLLMQQLQQLEVE